MSETQPPRDPLTIDLDGFEAHIPTGHRDGTSLMVLAGGVVALGLVSVVASGALVGTLVVAACLVAVAAHLVSTSRSRPRVAEVVVTLRGTHLSIEDPDDAQSWSLTELGEEPLRVRGDHLVLTRPDGTEQVWNVGGGELVERVVALVSTHSRHVLSRRDPGPSSASLAAVRALVDPGDHHS
ncbi:MAG: hypothetical protein H6738_23805 [Alphaproteobacteria bacterium]|nr:hypothetical protein [Alphaproteobacteria bacterium]MCB9699833.1 hypothetical protein [Alphaproteobacteria bacterium]